MLDAADLSIDDRVRYYDDIGRVSNSWRRREVINFHSTCCYLPVAVPPMFENTTSAMRIGFGSRLRT